MAAVGRRLVDVEERKRRRRAADQAIFDATLEALVCDLAHLELYRPGHSLRVEMSHRTLSPAKRPAPFMTESFPAVVRLMERGGFVSLSVGYRSDFGARQSTIRATEMFRELMDTSEVSWEDFGRDPDLLGPSIELRGEKRPKRIGQGVHLVAPSLALPDSEEVRRLSAEMTRINAWIGGAPLGWEGDCVAEGLDLSDRYLKRIFNNGRFDEGGRLYGGFWQRVSAGGRLAHLLIDGERVASVDFSQSAVRQAYARVGHPVPEGDLYDLPGLAGYRTETKQILNALLARDAPASRFPKHTRGRMPKTWKFSRVLEHIKRAHPPLVPLFGTGLGLRFMHQESEVVVRVLLTLIDRGVVALPVHDCILVPQSAASLTKEVMEQTFLEVVGVPGAVEIEGLPPGESLEGRPPQSTVDSTSALHKRGA